MKAPLATLVAAAAVGVSQPAQAAMPLLGPREAAEVARSAAEEFSDGVRGFKATCRRKTGRRRVCAIKFSDGTRRWTGSVAVTRGGLDASPVDTWSGSGTGSARYLGRQRFKGSGRHIVETRYGWIGDTLRLLGDDDQVDLVVGEPIDPFVSVNPFDTPEEGRRFIAFPITLYGSGSSRWARGGYPLRLIDVSGATVESSSAVGCDPTADVAPGETRQACVVFELPVGTSWQQVEYGAGQETGVWRA